jgi:hypothetical protein
MITRLIQFLTIEKWPPNVYPCSHDLQDDSFSVTERGKSHRVQSLENMLDV